MDLNNVNIVIRPRPALEGIDLGFTMASRWFLKLWGLWLCLALPFALVVHIICAHHTKWALFIVWWFKPLFETPLLYWLSRMIFNESHTLKHILKNLPKIVKPALLSRLTIGRLNPVRSFNLPVILLENTTGKEYQKRKAVLGHNQSAGLGLTIICGMFEGVFILSAMFLIVFLIPGDLQWIQLKDFIGDQTIPALIRNLICILSMSIIAPFYIASGFALYLSRRTTLEAWDLELNFKRLIKRKKSQKTFMVSIMLLCGVYLFQTALFDCKSAFAASKQESHQIIQDILKSNDFGHIKKVTTWRLKQFKTQEPTRIDWLNNLFAPLIKFFSFLVSYILWIAGGIIAVLFLYFASKYIGFFKPERSSVKSAPPKELFGLKISKDTIPDDIIGEVLKHLAIEDYRGALSLLYRGALFKLVFTYLLEIPKSATEGQCVTLVAQQRQTEEALFFEDMTGLWLKMAYGHIQPDRQAIEALCHGWNDFYGNRQP